MIQDKLILGKLADEIIEVLVLLEDDKLLDYISENIRKFYPKVTLNSDSKLYNQLVSAYRDSIYLEHILRENRDCLPNFTPIYTTTGLIESLNNNLFSVQLQNFIN